MIDLLQTGGRLRLQLSEARQLDVLAGLLTRQWTTFGQWASVTVAILARMTILHCSRLLLLREHRFRPLCKSYKR